MAQTTSVSAHLDAKIPVRGYVQSTTGRAVLSLGGDILPVNIFPESPAQLFLMGEECIRLAHEWNDRNSAHEILVDTERRRRLAVEETPATDRAELHDAGLDAVTPEDVAFG